ncbi:MAG: hypothetical protein ABR915_07725 [Thermoguttaceae bacterium]|jgi:hypothetical protein
MKAKTKDKPNNKQKGKSNDQALGQSKTETAPPEKFEEADYDRLQRIMTSKDATALFAKMRRALNRSDWKPAPQKWPEDEGEKLDPLFNRLERLKLLKTFRSTCWISYEEIFPFIEELIGLVHELAEVLGECGPRMFCMHKGTGLREWRDVLLELIEDSDTFRAAALDMFKWTRRGAR